MATLKVLNGLNGKMINLVGVMAIGALVFLEVCLIFALSSVALAFWGR